MKVCDEVVKDTKVTFTSVELLLPNNSAIAYSLCQMQELCNKFSYT